MFDEVGKSFVSEFDYRLEAQNLRKCGDNLLKAGFGSKAFIPEPVDALHKACPAERAQGGAGEGLCTRRVMVMDAVPGKPVKKVMKQVFADMAEAQGKTVAELMDEMKAEFEDPAKLTAMLNTPPPSETAVRVGIFLLGVKDCVRNGWAALYNYTVGLVAKPMAYHWTTTPPNGPALTRVLYDVHGHQVRGRALASSLVGVPAGSRSCVVRRVCGGGGRVAYGGARLPDVVPPPHGLLGFGGRLLQRRPARGQRDDMRRRPTGAHRLRQYTNTN
jgi:hypothetical protein